MHINHYILPAQPDAMEMRVGLSYDDVLLVPKRSKVFSRKEIDVSTYLTKTFKLGNPLTTANMDTVTEESMAIAMARTGGLGFLHRFCTIKDQVDMVRRVKRSESYVIENPYTIEPNKTVKEAKLELLRRGVKGLLVKNGGQLQGIVTNRDLHFEDDSTKRVEDVMTPRDKLVTAPMGTSIDDAKRVLHQHRIEKLPLLDESGNLAGLITSKDIIKINRFPTATKDEKGRLCVGAAVGVKEHDLDRAIALVEAGADVLVVDVAHGHSDFCIEMVRKIKDTLPGVQLVAGNVATAEGTRDLVDAGADCIKVGIGSGAACSTRIVTGSGIPQVTAVMDCAKVARSSGIPVMADSGIKNSGDVVKALAAGATTIMAGRLFAGTEESPGVTIFRNGRKYKIYRGNASFGANMGRRQVEGVDTMKEKNVSDIVPEGMESLVAHKGSIYEVVAQLLGGLRSGISYNGAKDIVGLQQNATFMRMTAAGMRESKPHDINIL